MKNLIKKIDGYKTYIGLVVMGVLGAALQAGWIDQSQFNMWITISGTWTGVSAAHKFDKLKNAVEGNKK